MQRSQTVFRKFGAVKILVHLTQGDGSCLLHATRHQLRRFGLQAPTVNELCQRIANYMSEHRERFEVEISLLAEDESSDRGEGVSGDAFEAGLNELKKPHVWLGKAALQALAEMFAARIIVLRPDGTINRFDPAVATDVELQLYYHQGCHYESVEPSSEKKRYAEATARHRQRKRRNSDCDNATAQRESILFPKASAEDVSVNLSDDSELNLTIFFIAIAVERRDDLCEEDQEGRH